MSNNNTQILLKTLKTTISLYLVFNEWRWEAHVVVCFVDFGGIVDHHWDLHCFEKEEILCW